MELINIQNNIVVIYNEGIDLSSLKTDPIELAIQDIFMEKNPKPIISKFPNQLAIIIPEAQTTITVSDRYLILTDQSIGDFTKKDSKRFFLLVGKVLSLIDKKSFKYGYNFIYDFSGLETSEILKLIGKKFFIDDAKSMVPKDDELEIALPVISFKHKKAQYVDFCYVHAFSMDDPRRNKVHN